MVVGSLPQPKAPLVGVHVDLADREGRMALRRLPSSR